MSHPWFHSRRSIISSRELIEDIMRVLALGGGFSGTVLSINILRLAESMRDLELTVVERKNSLGEGAAYGTSRREHLLNVPAGNMSCFPDEPDHLVKWLAQNAAKVALGDHERQPTSFIPRQVYSEYLKSSLEQSLCRAACSFKRVTDEAVSVDKASLSRSAKVHLASGEQLEAEKLVLCLGNEPSIWPFPVDTAAEPYLISTPWSFDPADIPRTSSVLVVGTGLTMADVITSLSHNGHEGPIAAISRRGILPKPHVAGLKPLPLQFAQKPRTLSEMYFEIMEKAARHTSLGGDWREVVDGLRPWTVQLWRSLSEADRQQLLAKGKATWDVHRHRIAPEIHDILQRQLDEGRLHVLSGRVEGIRGGRAAGVTASLRLAPDDGTEEREFDYVINCTGPNLDVRRSRNPLLRQLVADGLALPGSSGVGVQATDASRLLGRAGAVENVWVVGPLLMDRDFESIAVPELRVQAQNAAKSVLAPSV